jgi:Zn finger protein HypA/HybF involved in hydrogenase expression
MITDKQRIEWLAARVAYLEHANAEGVSCVKAPVGQYWPQNEEEAPADPDMVDLTLIEYVDAQITSEKLRTESLCWNCNKPYPKTAPTCPACRAINANVDPDGAQAQMEAA